MICQQGGGNLPVATGAGLGGDFPDPILHFGFSQLNRKRLYEHDLSLNPSARLFKPFGGSKEKGNHVRWLQKRRLADGGPVYQGKHSGPERIITGDPVRGQAMAGRARLPGAGTIHLELRVGNPVAPGLPPGDRSAPGLGKERGDSRYRDVPLRPAGLQPRHRRLHLLRAPAQA